MAFDNGTGQSGGNSSVWVEIQHGSASKRQQLEGAGLLAGLSSVPVSGTASAVGVTDRPASGQVKLANAPDGTHARVEIHDKTDLKDLGGKDHANMFRVRLRIRRQEIDAMIAADPKRRHALEAYWTALRGIAPTLSAHTGAPPKTDAPAVSDSEVYLVVDVPAITRKPGPNDAWPELPWEIYWQW